MWCGVGSCGVIDGVWCVWLIYVCFSYFVNIFISFIVLLLPLFL